MMPAQIAVLRAGVLLALALLPTMSVWAQCMQCENCQAGGLPCLGPDDMAFAGGHPGLPPAAPFGVTARSGPIFGASGGFLKDRMADPGFAIEVTARQPLGPGGCRSKNFFEIGGYFSQIYGDNSLVTTSGTFIDLTNPNLPVPTPLDNFFQTNLTRITRSAVQVGIGHRFSPHLLQWVCQRQPACQRDDFLTWRGGLRLGSVNASFAQTPTDTLQALIDAAGPGNFLLRDDVEDTDNFLALYTSLGLELLPFRIPLNQCQWIDGRLSIEGIYEHSWFELRNFTPSGNGLGTIGVQAGLNLAW